MAWLVAGAVVGAILSIGVPHRGWPADGIVATLGWDWWWPGAVAGALLAHLIWVMRSPIGRIGRVGLALIVLNR
jgi:hypothetical protein